MNDLLFTYESLHDCLKNHEKTVLSEIMEISDSSELNDEFLKKMAIKAFVNPLNIKVNDKKRRKNGDENSVTIIIPFDGDAPLLNCQPNTGLDWNPPKAIVYGQEIEFDVSLNDLDNVIKLIKDVEEKILHYANHVNDQVRKFNDKISEKITQVFKDKFDKIVKEEGLLANIPEEPKYVESTKITPPKQTEKPSKRWQQHIQINYNIGDVNNEYRSTK